MLNSDDSTIKMKAMPSHGASKDFCVVERFKSDECLGSTGEDMGFIESVKPTIPRLIEYETCECCDTLGSEKMSKYFPNSRNDLGLLSLIV